MPYILTCGNFPVSDGKANSLADFDQNGDQQIDLFTIVHSGYGAEAGADVVNRYIYVAFYALSP